MRLLNLSPYGFAVAIPVGGEFCESPAETADPQHAPLVFLVDENHDEVNQPAIVANAEDVASIAVAVPNLIVVLEHFPAGKPADAASSGIDGTGSNFHMLLQQHAPGIEAIGGDDAAELQKISQLHEEYEGRIAAIQADIRNPRPLADVLAEQDRVGRQGREKIRNHRAQHLRSRSLIDTLVAHLGGTHRVGVINAGANHNRHIWENRDQDGKPIWSGRLGVSLVRLRQVEELRKVSAYLNWQRRNRPLWEHLIDWAFAEQEVRGFGG